MADLIDREAVLHAIESASYWGHTFSALCDEVRDMPSVTPESLVRHGRWETVRSFGVDKCCRCFSCRTEWYFGCGGSVDNGSKFCPTCGAKMDLEE